MSAWRCGIYSDEGGCRVMREFAERVREWYELGIWSERRVREAQELGKLSEEEYAEIVKGEK